MQVSDLPVRKRVVLEFVGELPPAVKLALPGIANGKGKKRHLLQALRDSDTATCLIVRVPE
jgi:hypothetical protein